MGDKSKYSDEKLSNGESDAVCTLPEHQVLPARVRRFAPSNGSTDTGGQHSTLIPECTGDWSWKPGRDRTATVMETFRTFRGVPPGGAELSHRDFEPIAPIAFQESNRKLSEAMALSR